LGKIQIPKSSEEFQGKTEKGRKMSKNTDLNKLAFTELILSIEVSSCSGKLAFGISKSCKRKDFEDGNASMTWDKLKKLDPVSAPTLVKTKRLFRDSKLGKNEDPEIWINNM
jgi:hypothetical protein